MVNAKLNKNGRTFKSARSHSRPSSPIKHSKIITNGQRAQSRVRRCSSPKPKVRSPSPLKSKNKFTKEIQYASQIYDNFIPQDKKEQLKEMEKEKENENENEGDRASIKSDEIEDALTDSEDFDEVFEKYMSDQNEDAENNEQIEEKGSEVDPHEKERLDKIKKVLQNQGTCPAENTKSCFCTPNLEISKKINSVVDQKVWITMDRLHQLRKVANDAAKSHKVFTIRGCFYSIRKALLHRGWIEKLDIHRRTSNSFCQMVLEDWTNSLPPRRPGESKRLHIMKCERNIMSRFLENCPIDFLWSVRRDKSDWIDMIRNPSMLMNKLTKTPFTSKEGLCRVLRDHQWFYEPGKSEICYPRCYNIWRQEELEEFTDDFRLSCCISLLRWFCNHYEAKDIDTYITNIGTIPMSTFDFALERCRGYLNFCNHNDIDEEPPHVWEFDWELVLKNHHQLLYEGFKICQTSVQPKELYDRFRPILNDVAHKWPQYSLDGVHNVWIIKPANRCRGRGIHLVNSLKKVAMYADPAGNNSKGRYVVQKYIERPLIIHKTKFDIRQWFLVTSVQPLIVWMYKESYLRFSTQQFSLKNYHESVHLTNHAIQKRYKNSDKRDNRLPRDNMWDCHTFQTYLKQIEKGEMWEDRIFPGMKMAITAAMLASQDTMDRRTNSYELFGADFMVTEDFYPWLIEINSSPDLGATTSVTSRLCPQCLEDVIKVVVDKKFDCKADTGGFELIYKQVIPPAPSYLGLNLFLKGNQMSQVISGKDVGLKKQKSNHKSALLGRRHVQQPLIHTERMVQQPTMSPCVSDLMDIIRYNANNCQSISTNHVRKKMNRIPMVHKQYEPSQLNTNISRISGQLGDIKSTRSILRISSRNGQSQERNLKQPKCDTERKSQTAKCLSRVHNCDQIVKSVKLRNVISSRSSTTASEDVNKNKIKKIQCTGLGVRDDLISCSDNRCNGNILFIKSSDVNRNNIIRLNANKKIEKSIENSAVKPTRLYKICSSSYCNGKLRSLSNVESSMKPCKFANNPNENSRRKTDIIKTIAADQYRAHSDELTALGLSFRAWQAKYEVNKINSQSNSKKLLYRNMAKSKTSRF